MAGRPLPHPDAARARSGARWAHGFATLALAAGCRDAGPARPNVLLVTLDTTRADALSCYGVHRGTTPRLDELAAEGVLYENASTVAPLTLPAHASLLTGLTPLRHGVRDNGLWPLPEEADTLAERASAAGWSTAAFVSAVVLDGRFGLDQGFAVYDVPARAAEQRTSHYGERDARATVDAALAWLEGRERGAPFLVWVHLFDPHAPYAPPERWRGGGLAGAPYLGEVAFADHELGRLFDALRAEGSWERTFIAVAGDHGEAFGEHGELSHGPFCWESTLRVPLLLRDPAEERPGRRSEELVSVVDLHPTLLEAMGLEPAPGVDGQSLLAGPMPSGTRERGVYFESYTGYLSLGWSPLAGWRDGAGKYLHSSRPVLYDLASDPGETRDLLAQGSVDPRPWRLALAEHALLPRLRAGEAAAQDPELLAELRGLGYAAVGAPREALPDPLAPSDRPSPLERVEEHRATLQALERFNAGDVEAAHAAFERIAAENPRNLFVLDLLAYARMRLGRHADAIEPLRRLLAQGPERADSLYNLGLCLARGGRAAEAEEALARALELDPAHAGARDALERVRALRAGGASAASGGTDGGVSASAAGGGGER